MYRFGVDIGGTFTDLVIQDGETGLIETLKVPSTPDDPSEAVLNAVRLAASDEKLKIDLGSVVQLIHGTTVAMRRSIGGAASYGCIRMYNEDVIDLFDRVDVGTRVLMLR